jgi:hypothetical protein
MTSRRRIAGWSTCSLFLLATCCATLGNEAPTEISPPAATQTPFAHAPVEHTGSVTLGTLSVKPLGVDLPWDPRICIGCDRNNGPSPPRDHHQRHR